MRVQHLTLGDPDADVAGTGSIVRTLEKDQIADLRLGLLDGPGSLSDGLGRQVISVAESEAASLEDIADEARAVQTLVASRVLAAEDVGRPKQRLAVLNQRRGWGR